MPTCPRFGRSSAPAAISPRISPCTLTPSPLFKPAAMVLLKQNSSSALRMPATSDSAQCVDPVRAMNCQLSSAVCTTAFVGPVEPLRDCMVSAMFVRPAVVSEV